MNYRQRRDYENCQRMIFPGEGQYQIPKLFPDDPRVERWIPYNYAKKEMNPERCGIHFFIDDYQFVRLWNDPKRYLSQLAVFDAVCTPDFSMYTDFPKAVQIFNWYRSQWLGAYWQSYGIRVIPTIGWSTPDSFDWCFDGVPRHSTVACSAQGTQNSEKTKKLFMDGWKAMLRRLEPSRVIFYGDVPEGCEGPIEPMGKSFFRSLRHIEGRE